MKPQGPRLDRHVNREHTGRSSLPPVETFLHYAPRDVLRRMPDRETFAWPEDGVEAGFEQCPPAERVIVKRTTGSPARDAWYERLHGLRVRSPAMREHSNLLALAADGVCVPRALACFEEPRRAGLRGRGARSVVVMEYVAHGETLRERAGRASAAEQRACARALLELVLTLHGRGWYHRDLYLQHVLVRGEARGSSIAAGLDLVLIDVGRARKEAEPRARWFVKDLAAILHSTPPSVGVRERMRFLARYLDRRGIESRAERRWWFRGVVAKAARIAAHVPRFGEAGAAR